MKSLTEQARTFPTSPGVYLFKGKKNEMLYVGKAKNLKKRIQAYFFGKDDRTQISFLLKKASQLEFIVTATEKEALLLENTLIKQHRPHYNIDLRDDKNYISIRIGLEHSSPGIATTRRVIKDGASYFGPYASAAGAREAVDQITRFFRVRTCTDREFSNRVRPCLKYDIGRCTAPCVKLVSKEAYAHQVEDAVLFLRGRSRELLHRLKERMDEASLQAHFEEAARMRDALFLLEGLNAKQKVVVHGGGDYDAISFARVGDDVSLCLLMVRHGALLDRLQYRFHQIKSEDDDLLSDFLIQHYLKRSDIPPEILIPFSFEGQQAGEELLREKSGRAVRLITPKRGLKRDMVLLAERNAQEELKRLREKKEGIEEILSQLAQKLGLSNIPRVVECVDISNLSGREAVGSLVCFVDGEPQKNRYRLYTIRSLNTPDDYGMMMEVLKRRFGVEASGLYLPFPDILLIDGGKGQLAVALRALEEIGVTGLSVAAIAKAKEERESDQIYIPLRKNPVTFKKGSKELLYLMRIRDEAHRFGLKTHRKQRTRKMLTDKATSSS